MHKHSRQWSLAVVTLVLSACGGDAGTAEEETPDPLGHSGHGGDAGTDAASADGGQTGWCQVKQILETNCTSCHIADGVGPMPLVTYADVTAHRSNGMVYDRIAARVHDKKAPMPPTGVLGADALAVIDAWVAAGAPNDGSCQSSDDPVVTPTAWPTNCDGTYRILSHGDGGLESPYVIPGNQEIHPQIVLDAPWGDEEVQAIAFRPITDNGKVIHHWILNDRQSTFLSGWAPGGDGGGVLPDDIGMYMPRGAKSLVLDMHYFNTGNAQAAQDRSGVEVCVLKKAHFRPKLASVFRGFASYGGTDLVLAPAHSENHDETGVCKVKTTQPVHVMSAAPHAHTFAVHMKFTVKKADGRVIVMHDKPFSFHAQGSYPLADDLILETGDVVETTCTYTNSTDRNVNVGESTQDEMCFNFAAYYPMGALSCSNRFGI